LKLYLGTLDAGMKVRWVHTISSGLIHNIEKLNHYGKMAHELGDTAWPKNADSTTLCYGFE